MSASSIQPFQCVDVLVFDAYTADRHVPLQNLFVQEGRIRERLQEEWVEVDAWAPSKPRSQQMQDIHGPFC